MLKVKEKKKKVAQDANSAPKEHRLDKFEVRVVSVTGDKLVVTSKSGKNYSFRLAKDAKIAWGGKAGKLEDLMAGSEIRVTTKPDDRNLVIEIESINNSGKAEDCCS